MIVYGAPYSLMCSPMYFFERFLVAALLMATSSVTVWAGDSSAEISQWFDKMSRAGQQLSYEGTFMYRRGDKIMTMKIIHVADENGEREHIISLNGPLREVVRDRSGVTHISADNKKTITVDKRAPPRLVLSKTPEQIEQIEKNYTFSVSGDARTANRRARVISITPKDMYRYGYRVSLDYQTGLLLQSELLSEEGAPLEQIIFITFDVLDKARIMALNDILASSGASGAAQEVAEDAAASKVLPGDEAWKVSKIPVGFVLVEHKRRMGKNGTLLDHMVFTDGLASVSVFMEKDTPHNKMPFSGISRMGAVSAFARRVNGHQVTVMGEVPVAAVQMIGESIHYPVMAGTKK